MALIRGFAAHAAGAELVPYKYESGELQPEEVEIRISHCGICYSDIHLINNDWSLSKFPFIPGHEIVGTVTAIGDNVKLIEAGQRVGVGWQADSCGTCEWCKRGKQNLCAFSQGTCVQRNGGYADSIRIKANFVLPIPERLDSEAAAPLMCAGITVYNPLRTHGINPSSRVGVIGIGGLGHLAVQFARAFGAEVTAFSTSAAKEQDALALGAHFFVNTRETKALKKLAGCFDFILSTINTEQDWSAYVSALRPTGTFCFLGAPSAPASLPIFPLVSGMKSITGSPTGSPLRIAEMLDVAARHNIKARTERFALTKVNEAIAKVKKNQIRYRAVLTV